MFSNESRIRSMLSETNSRYQGKIQGIFVISAGCSSLKSLYRTASRTFIAFSCRCNPLKNREFSIAYQGNAFPDT
jgi:hypothetical protein